MNHAGNNLLNHIDKVVLQGYLADERQVFFARHEVQSVTLLDNGDILTTAIKRYIDPEDKKEYETFVQFKSKAIVLSNGAKQFLHPLFYKEWFPFMAEPQMKKKVMLSDDFMRLDIFKKTCKKLIKKNQKNIVIVGGSHSGFSCAWLLLNGPADYKKEIVKFDPDAKEYPHSRTYVNKKCKNCCVCSKIT